MYMYCMIKQTQAPNIIVLKFQQAVNYAEIKERQQ